MMSSEIDRNSPVPFYHQLKTLLRSEIARKKLAPGDRLLGDHRLCEQYGISRTVVRQALTELEYEGLIVRVRGRGTFVAIEKAPQGLVQSLRGLHQDVSAHGQQLRSDVRRFEFTPADEAMAENLGVEPGTTLLLIERLRYIDAIPWVLTVTHLPADLLPDLTATDLRTGSLYAIMDENHIRLVRSRRSVEARTASSSLARDLGLDVGAPVLFLSSVSFADDGRPVEVFQAFHRGDRSRFEVELTADKASAIGPMMTGPTVL